MLTSELGVQESPGAEGGGDLEEGRRPLSHPRGAAEQVVEEELVVRERRHPQQHTHLWSWVWSGTCSKGCDYNVNVVVGVVTNVMGVVMPMGTT